VSRGTGSCPDYVILCLDQSSDRSSLALSRICKHEQDPGTNT